MTIERFLDDQERIKTWPGKKDMKIEVLRYLATKFQVGKKYTEKDVNNIIQQWHTFNDYFILRRGLIDYKLLCRTKTGSEYWREEVSLDE